VARAALKALPAVQVLVATDQWRSWRYRWTLLTARREYHSYTTFFRLPAQFVALGGPVLEFLGGGAQGLEIAVLGCSSGAEPYSIAAYLSARCPGVPFRIRAIDLNPELVAAGRRAEYPAAQVLESPMDTDLVTQTFDHQGDAFVVKPDIARHVTFEQGDMLDPNLGRVAGSADIVFAQNVLYHLPPRLSRRAFLNAYGLLKPRGAMFVDGMDVPQRTRLTRELNLRPLDFRVREIHEDARVLRGGVWPWTYWGLEPFSATARDAVRRYATIFLK
jgi:chemotaxis methyl-accepting protein methylase